ncbi:MAG: GntR family transcriptional regulator [Rubellimicrobium sp.]|nr:GntR family transcriptional regulator [Rubellimicrobium sp.]
MATETSTMTPALSPIPRPRTAAEEVEDRLILAIARGDKLPGERLTEAEISTALGVSRVPAREAMQKLQLRGILVGHGLRGLKVADYSPRRIAELIELRLAIEKIFFRHVMREGADRAPLVAKLERILDEMGALSGVGDPVALSSVDLEFHRTIAVHSGNELAIQIWEGLAQHMLIIFCRDWAFASDRTGEVVLHRHLLDFLREGDVAGIGLILEDHFTAPGQRPAINT